MKKVLRKVTTILADDEKIIEIFDKNGNVIDYTHMIFNDTLTSALLNKHNDYDYDENNNIIHSKDSDGFEYWNEYDKNNNLIHHKNSDGYEYWYEYDENNNEIHYKDSDGFEYYKEYDENNNCIHYKDSDGYEYWYEYDENNNEIHCSYINSENNKTEYEVFKKYNKDNLVVYIEIIYYNKDNEIIKCLYDYDKNGNIIYYRENNIITNKLDEYYYSYDENNNIIYELLFCSGKKEFKCNYINEYYEREE